MTWLFLNKAFLNCFLTTFLMLAAAPIGANEKPEVLQIGAFACYDRDGKKSENENGLPDCEIGQIAKTEVVNFAAWAKDLDAQWKNDPLSKLVLSVDGQALTGSTPRIVEENGRNFLLFDLVGNDENRGDWIVVLKRNKLFRAQLMNLGIHEIESVRVFESTKVNFSPASIKRAVTMFFLWLVVVVVAYILLIRKGMLRESGSARPDGNPLPYSLARTQMAFWFVIVYTCFIWLWLVIGAVDTLNASVLGLIGISAGTGLSAVAIGSPKQHPETRTREELGVELDRLETSLKNLQNDVSESELPMTAEQKGNEQKLREDIAELKIAQDWVEKDGDMRELKKFFRDIFFEKGRVTFSRYQIVAWTLILGVIFTYSVFTNLEMPEFDATLLGLMAISGGTYIGFKFPQAPNV